MAGRTRTAAEEDLHDLLTKQPELRAYMLPATAGDIADLGKKLDEIADLLRRLTNEQGRIADAAHMPEPGHVVVDHIPGVATSIRATLLPGMALTLPPMPDEDGGRETHRKLGRLLREQQKMRGLLARYVASGSA